MLKVLTLATAALVALPGQAAPMEIGEFIARSAAAHSKGSFPWSFMATAQSPITWETDGIDTQGDKRSRRGTANLAVNGFVPQVLKKVVEPERWSVRLGGDKFGVYEVSLSNSGCQGSAAASENCADRLGMVEASIKKAGLAIRPVCQFGPGGAHTKLFAVTSGKNPPLFVTLETDSGSSGTSVGVTMYPHSGDSADLMTHATTVCSLLFRSRLGDESQNARSYPYLRSLN